MKKRFYITTPIYYVNAKPHLGHAYTTIMADTACRFHNMLGQETLFLTGTDEHGDKVVKAAVAENLTPGEYADRISGLYKTLWDDLGITYDRFIRTTDKDHMQTVESVLNGIYDSGDIYFSEYEGLYCYGCERFYTEKELVGGKCPDHETEPEIVKEANYFFKMSKYQDWLVGHIKSNPDFIRPERYRNEVLGFLKSPLEDLCISRPKSRLDWGITLPFDSGYVTYVWFDALINYISACAWPDGEMFKKFWPCVQHVVAKDILKPHGIYWPIMLKSAGIPLYGHLNVHGYWNVKESKMSKSLGNVVDPFDLKKRYGNDSFRYFLAREMVFGLDSSFSEEALVQRINSDLANDLGNLFSRVLGMTGKYFSSEVPENAMGRDAQKESGIDLEDDAMNVVEKFEEAGSEFKFNAGLEHVWSFIGRLNKYVDENAPWVMAKDETRRDELKSVIYNLLESLRIISGLVWPVMPDTAAAMQRHLGLSEKDGFFNIDVLKQWGVLQPGTKIDKKAALFPRIEVKKT